MQDKHGKNGQSSRLTAAKLGGAVTSSHWSEKLLTELWTKSPFSLRKCSPLLMLAVDLWLALLKPTKRKKPSKMA